MERGVAGGERVVGGKSGCECGEEGEENGLEMHALLVA